MNNSNALRPDQNMLVSRRGSTKNRSPLLGLASLKPGIMGPTGSGSGGVQYNRTNTFNQTRSANTPPPRPRARSLPQAPPLSGGSSLPQAPSFSRASSLPQARPSSRSRGSSMHDEPMTPHQVAVEINHLLISQGKSGLDIPEWVNKFRDNNVTTFAGARKFYNNEVQSSNVKSQLHRNQQKKEERTNTVIDMVFNITGIPLAFASAGIGLKLLKWGFTSILHSISSSSNNRYDSNNWIFQKILDWNIQSKQVAPAKMMNQVFRVVFYNIPLVGGVFQSLLRSNGRVEGFYFPKSKMDTKDRRSS